MSVGRYQKSDPVNEVNRQALSALRRGASPQRVVMNREIEEQIIEDALRYRLIPLPVEIHPRWMGPIRLEKVWGLPVDVDDAEGISVVASRPSHIPEGMGEGRMEAISG